MLKKKTVTFGSFTKKLFFAGLLYLLVYLAKRHPPIDFPDRNISLNDIYLMSFLSQMKTLRRGLPECHFLATSHGFNENISFMFQAIQKLSSYLTSLCYGVFCKYFGDFWVFFGEKSFSQRMCKI